MSVTIRNMSYEGDCADCLESRYYQQRYSLCSSYTRVKYGSLEHSINFVFYVLLMIFYYKTDFKLFLKSKICSQFLLYNIRMDSTHSTLRL